MRININYHNAFSQTQQFGDAILELESPIVLTRDNNYGFSVTLYYS